MDSELIHAIDLAILGGAFANEGSDKQASVLNAIGDKWQQVYGDDMTTNYNMEMQMLYIAKELREPAKRFIRKFAEMLDTAEQGGET